MFGLSYVDPALISDVLRRASSSATHDGQAVVNPEAGTERAAPPGRAQWPENSSVDGGDYDPVPGPLPNQSSESIIPDRTDALLGDLAYSLPLYPEEAKPVDTEEANFWLRFDPNPHGILNPLAEHLTIGSLLTDEFFSGRSPGMAMADLREIRSAAEAEAGRQFPGETLHNTRCDAFRHAYLSYLLARRYGSNIAKQITDAWEVQGGNPPAELYMDLTANRFGREFYGHPGLENVDPIAGIRRAIDIGALRSRGYSVSGRRQR